MFKKETWPNGLRTIYVPMKNTKTVTVLVLVGVGSRYETKDTNGLSHFLEHMCFKGTTKRPDRRQIVGGLDAIGAEYNAFTDKEYTGYYVKTDNKHVELAVDVVSDIFLNSTVPAAEIEKERGVIIGEIDMYEDMPMRKVGDVFEKLLYPNHPVGWSIAGVKKVIRSLKRDDFINYRQRYYRAGNTVVIVAGNISLAKARQLVKKYFTGIKQGRAAKPLPIREQQKKPALKINYKKTDQTHFILGSRAFDTFDKRRWPLGLLGVILGGNSSSRLFTKMREELGLGYYIRASSGLSTDHGTFDVSTGVDNRRVEEAVSAVVEELVRAKKDGVSEKELKDAKEFVRGSTIMGLESSDELASFYGSQELITRKILTDEEKFRMLDKVTASDVKRVASDVFQSRKLNLALIGPVKNSRGLLKLLK